LHRKKAPLPDQEEQGLAQQGGGRERGPRIASTTGKALHIRRNLLLEFEFRGVGGEARNRDQRGRWDYLCLRAFLNEEGKDSKQKRRRGGNL